MASEGKVQVLPPGFKPIQATYGDEKQTTDVTASILAKLRGATLDVVSSSKLIPALSYSDSVELTDEETQKIQKQAADECGSPNDKRCMDTLRDRYAQAKLVEKANLQAQTGPITGERLTIVAANEKGQQRTFYVPKDSRIVAGDTATRYLSKEATKEQAGKFWDTIQPTVFTILGTAAGAFLYVFSVLTTWRNMTEYGYKNGRYLATGIAILIPYSGFLIQLGFWAALRFGSEYWKAIERKATQTS